MKEFMQKFDKNKDGRIEMSEVRLWIGFMCRLEICCNFFIGTGKCCSPTESQRDVSDEKMDNNTTFMYKVYSQLALLSIKSVNREDS